MGIRGDQGIECMSGGSRGEIEWGMWNVERGKVNGYEEERWSSRITSMGSPGEISRMSGNLHVPKPRL